MMVVFVLSNEKFQAKRKTVMISLLNARSRGHFTLIKSDVLILFVFRQNLEEDEEELDEMKFCWIYERRGGLSLSGDFHFTETFKTLLVLTVFLV